MTMAPRIIPEPAGPTRIMVCPDGPLLVRGPMQILDAAGNVAARTRQTLALCRCGEPRLARFCDGTHQWGPTRDRTGIDTGRDGPKPGRT